MTDYQMQKLTVYIGVGAIILSTLMMSIGLLWHLLGYAAPQ